MRLPRRQPTVQYTIRCPYCERSLTVPPGVVRCPSCSGKITVYPSTTPAQAQVAARPSISNELERLVELRRQGLLSDEGFAAAKQRVLRTG